MRTKKILLTIITLGFVVQIKAQDKVVDLELKEKHEYVGHDFAIDGSFFLATANDKPSKTDLNLFSFDSETNLKFKKNTVSKFKGLPGFFGRGSSTPQIYYDMEATFKGKFLVSYKDKLVFNDKGEQKNFDINEIDESQKFKTNFFIYSDKLACFFGNKEDKSKKDKVSEEVYFYKVNFEDQSKTLIEVKFPIFKDLIEGEIIRDKKESTKVKWGISSQDENGFIMINKIINKTYTENQYNIVEFDYNGNIISTMSIPLKLDKAFFVSSNIGFGSAKIIYSDMVGAALMTTSSTGNIYFDKENNEFYIYGLYTKSKISDINKIKYNGFYVNKFNSKGELIWQQKKDINDNDGFNKLQRPFAVDVKFSKNQGNIGFLINSFYEKYTHMYMLDSKKGEIIKNKKPEIKIEGNMLEGIRGSAFPTGYAIEKVYVNKHMDINTVFASFLNPKIDAFLKSKSEDDLNYNCKISYNGIYIIEENYKNKNLRLLKFNW
jgi:hypothetical protein